MLHIQRIFIPIGSKLKKQTEDWLLELQSENTVNSLPNKHFNWRKLFKKKQI